MPNLDGLFEVKSHIPALLPIGEAAKSIVLKGDILLARSCIDRCALYSIEKPVSVESETLSCENMHFADSMEVSEIRSEGIISASWNAAVETACRRNRDPEPLLRTDAKMEYCPPTPANSIAINETLDCSGSMGSHFLIGLFCCNSLFVGT